MATGCQSSRPAVTVTPASPFQAAADSYPLSSESASLPKYGLVSYRQPRLDDSTSNVEDVDSALIQSDIPPLVSAPADPVQATDQSDKSDPSDKTDQSDETDLSDKTDLSEEITLDRVLKSVQQCYPEIDVTIGEIEAAHGKLLSTWGQFDSVFAAHSISQPIGFYQTYRNGAGITQPLVDGGEVYGTYRIGDGNFEPWYGERETNEGGEFKAGFSLPLLKDRAVDNRRASVRSAEASRSQVEADVASRLLQFQRLATQAYWDWVASGRAVQVQQRLLDLAQVRVNQINVRVEKGDLAKLAQIDNDRFIAKRKNDLIKSRRSMEKSAIKLSMFYRDKECLPVIAGVDQLPAEFPSCCSISSDQRDADITTAIAIRPELGALAAARQQTLVDLDYANNLTLPKLDMKGFAGQDIGAAASSKGDKTPFELQVGLYAEVPLQRREAYGKIQMAEGKLAQLDAKIRLLTDKIRAEVQDTASAVNAAYEQIEQSQKNVDLTRRSLELGRQAFEAGDVALIELNIYETAVADAELQLLDAQFKYFYYRAVYETAKSAVAFVPLP